MADIPLLEEVLDDAQQAVLSLDFPAPPTVKESGQFFLDILSSVSESLGLLNPFPSPMPNPPVPPLPDPRIPAVPQIPKSASPFKLPFSRR